MSKILVVDDQEAVRTALGLLFELHGLEVIAASTAEQALDAVRTADVGVVIQDMNLAQNTTSGQEGIALFRQIRALDPNLPVYPVKTLEQYRRDYLIDKRFQAALIGGFGLLALALASLGLYGALSYSVAQRTQEIGVRMALGARAGDVLWLVVGQGIRLTAIGGALGLAGAFVAARVLKSLLYGVTATDPLTFIVIPLLLTLVALLACWIPARRATKVDPMIALRCE